MRRVASALALLCVFLALAAQDGSRGLAVVRGAGAIEEMKGNAGKRYAICIGINKYEDTDIKALEKAQNDAKGLGEVLKSSGQFDSVQVMTDDIDPRFDAQRSYPRLSNIRGKLKYLEDFITPNDLVVVSFSGHGIANEKGESYLITADTSTRDPFATGFAVQEILNWLVKIKVRKSLLLIDACRETVAQRASRGMANTNIRAEQYERAEVAAVFYATRTGWYSYEDRESPYGVFTRFLLDGIKGKADYQYGNRDGIVTFRELSGFVEDAVSSYALGQGLKQRPYTKILGETFGDLALSTYSASIDTGTRAEVSAAGKEPETGFGEAQIYSNVEGQVKLDGAPHGSIGKGGRLVIEELPAGSHFLEIASAYGVLKKELPIKNGYRTSVVNLVIQSDRDPRALRGTTFVHMKGTAGMPGFWIGESEVTFGQFADFVQQSGYAAQGSWQQYYKPAFAFYPVIHVTWDDCMAYVKWLAKKTGADITLPTAAQWRYAAGGKQGTVYPWGDEWDPAYCQGADSEAPGVLPIVNEKGPVQEQFFQMDMTLDGATHLAGNVREWCADQKKAADGVALLAATAGGSWRLSKPKYFAADYSSFSQVSASEEDLGFRVAIRGD
jgi:hypothetical protein